MKALIIDELVIRSAMRTNQEQNERVCKKPGGKARKK
jgi:hypothetical protein